MNRVLRERRESLAAAPHRMVNRFGIPNSGGHFVRYAQKHRLPVLFSANCFARYFPRGHPHEAAFSHFVLPDPEQFDGLDAALDSAGFIAAVEYGEYPWTVEQFLDLAASRPWSWYASMDYCVEPEVARDRPLRILRIAGTVARYYQCLRAAERRNLPPPIPVLQGYRVQELLECIEWYGFGQTCPPLIGVGSVCRRHLRGTDGIYEIVDALHRNLPSGTQCHFFGVKSEALSGFAHHGLIRSTDSMAWDAAARRKRRVGRTVQFRTQCLEEWGEMQRQYATTRARGAGIQSTLPMLFDTVPETNFEKIILEALALQHADLLMSQDVSYLDAVWLARQDEPIAIALVRQRGRTDRCLAALDDLIAGMGDRVEALRHQYIRRC